MIAVATVVEGEGEVSAVPALIRNLAYTRGFYDVATPRPILLPRSNFLIPADFARAVELATRQVGEGGGVIALLDADDDCALELVKRISAGYQGGRRFALVAAVREYESIFLPRSPGFDPEAVRDAKGAIRETTGLPYRVTAHQTSLSATLDLDHARQCRWFRKFEHELLAILRG